MRRIELVMTAAIVVGLAVTVAAARGAPAVPRGTQATQAAATVSPAPPNTSGGSSSALATAEPKPTPIMFGATGQYKWEIQRREEELGKHLEAARVFRRWGQPLFDEDQLWARDTGHTIFVSVKSRHPDGSKIKWRNIADAGPGSRLHDEMLRQARQIRDFGAPVYVTFNHEPDAKTSRAMGDAAEFVAAWRNVIDTYREAGVSNARYVWVMTEAAFHSDAAVAAAYYPGDGYVDHIGVDAYNWFGCATEKAGDGRWRSPERILAGHRRFGEQHPGKGLMVLEWGSAEDPERPGRKARWIRDAAELFLQPRWGQYRVILHYDARSLETKQSPCDFDYQTSSSALAAWRDMGNHPAYDARSSHDIENIEDLVQKLLDSLTSTAVERTLRSAVTPAPSLDADFATPG